MEGLKAMPYPLVYGFALVGIIGLCCIVGFFCIIAYDAIKDKYKKHRAKRIYKNRFNKKPLSECYCKDCIWFDPLEWDETIGKCARTGRNEPDNFFCNAAYPKSAKDILSKERAETPMDDE